MDSSLWLIGVHLFTSHAGQLTDGIQRHAGTPGIYAVAPSGLTAGVYRNSLSQSLVYSGNRWSFYAGQTWHTGLSVASSSVHDVTLTAALVTGYARPVNLLLGVGARIGHGDLAPRIMWVPHRAHPLSLSLERAF